jgi:hypothetical protein
MGEYVVTVFDCESPAGRWSPRAIFLENGPAAYFDM